MFDDNDACSSSSATVEMNASEISNEFKKMKEKKRRITPEERALLKKKLLEEENQLRKEKATKAMNYLLQHSQKYSLLFSDTIQNNNNPNTKS